MNAYIALIHKEADSDYGVSFPDLPGCITAGTTLDEARALAEDALALHLSGMADDGEVPAESSSLAVIMDDRENRDGVAVLVPVRDQGSHLVRVDITLPADALEGIDRYAQRHGMSRSGFLVHAAKRAIDQA